MKRGNLGNGEIPSSNGALPGAPTPVLQCPVPVPAVVLHRLRIEVEVLALGVPSPAVADPGALAFAIANERVKSEMAFAFEDPSQSDTPVAGGPSGPSDCGTPYPEGRNFGDVQSAMWESIKQLGRSIAEVRDVTGALGTFREAIGMNDNGPVIPRLGSALRVATHSPCARRPEPPLEPQPPNEETQSSTQSTGLGVFSMSRSVDGHLGLGFGGLTLAGAY
eukprot:s376_g12.t1